MGRIVRFDACDMRHERANGMRAVVTGASGFAGRHLLHHLLSAGDEVTPSSTEITDARALAAEFRQCRPEAVYHLAAQADVSASWSEPVATLRVNVEGTFNVLAAARRAGARRVVAVSSADVYGRVSHAGLPVAESAPLRPVTPYGASKAAAEMMCLQAGHGARLEVIRARAFNHFGPGQSDRFVASALASRIADNERSGAALVPAGNMEAKRDFTDVRDVVRAYRLLACAGSPGEAYNVCSGVARSIRELADGLLMRAAHPMTVTEDPELFRAADVPEMRGDPSKLHTATGWRPEIPLSQTLDELLEHWRCETARMHAGLASRSLQFPSVGRAVMTGRALITGTTGRDSS